MSKRASAVWGMTQNQDPGVCSLSSLIKATSHSVFSSVSSPLCPPFARDQGKWLQVKIYVLAIEKPLCISSYLFLVERNPVTFHNWMLSGYLSGSGAVGWGAQLGVQTPHFPRESLWPLRYFSGTSAAACGTPASPLMSPLHSIPVTLC